MKAKTLLSLLLAFALVIGLMTTLAVTASAGIAVTLHPDAECDEHPTSKHAFITAVDASAVTFTLYDVDGSKTENQSLPVSYFDGGTPAVGEWWYGDFMYYGKCDGTHKAKVFLDLESATTDVKDSKTFDQTYTLTTSDAYTDVTKVKVEWTITDITAARKDAKVWNPDTLSWVDDNESDVVTPGNANATFVITNLSSVKVDAKVEFTAKTGFTPEVVYSGVDEETLKTTVASVVKDNKSVDKSITHSATVTVTVTPDEGDFATKSAAAAAQYGTYTVTLSKTAKMLDLQIAQSGGGWAVSSVTVNGQTVNVTKTRDSDGYITVKAGDAVVVNFSQERTYSAYSYTTEEPTGGEPTNVILSESRTPTGSASFTVPNLDGVVGLVFGIFPLAS